MANYSTNGAPSFDGMSYENSQRSNEFGSLPNNGNPFAAPSRPNPNHHHPQQQQPQTLQPGVNPFNVYTPAPPHPTVTPSQAQVSMVPAQQTNQWSLQPQQPQQNHPQLQQQHRPQPQQQHLQQNFQKPQQQQQHNLQRPQQNLQQSQQHLQQSQHAQQYHPHSQKPVPPKSDQFDPFTTFDPVSKPVRAAQVPTVSQPMQQLVPSQSQPVNRKQQQQQQQQQVPNNNYVDDLFGGFSTNANVQRPTEIVTNGGDGHDNLSVLSKSTTGGTNQHQRKSPLDDPNFAPPPPRIQGLENIQMISQHAPPNASPLPDIHKVTHSGFVLSRISFRSILIKKWKQVFWISYGNTKLLIFRSSADFEDWVTNPYLTKNQRQFLIKMEVDFVNDLCKINIRGYQVTNIGSKTYQNKLLNQFKLERWMDYGPTIAAAFASPIEKDVYNLRVIISEMMKRSPQEMMLNIVQPVQNNPHAIHNTRPYESNVERYGANNSNYISGAASTGAVSDGGGSQRSARSMRSYGVTSTGPMERMRDPIRDGFGGYRAR